MDVVTILFQSRVCTDLQYYQTHKKNPLCVHVKVLCEMCESSDPHILEGSPVSSLIPGATYYSFHHLRWNSSVESSF